MASATFFGIFSLALMISSVASHPFKLRESLDGYRGPWDMNGYQPPDYGSLDPSIISSSSRAVYATTTNVNSYSVTMSTTYHSAPVATGIRTGCGSGQPTGYINKVHTYEFANKKRRLFQGPRHHDFVHYYPYVASYGNNTPTGGSSTGGTYHPTNTGTFHPTGTHTGTVGTYHPTATLSSGMPTSTTPTATTTSTTNPTSPYPTY